MIFPTTSLNLTTFHLLSDGDDIGRNQSSLEGLDGTSGGGGSADDSFYDEGPDCVYYPAEALHIKVPLVAVFGTSVAGLSFISNVFLFFNLISRRRLRESSHMFYLIFIVFVDLFISVSYIFIMTIQVLYDYLPSLMLYNAWMGYMKPLLTLSTVCLVCSTYLIVAWTFERFVTTVYPGCIEYTGRSRLNAVLIALLMGVVARGTTFGEIHIGYYPNCTGFERIHIEPSSWTVNYWYRTIWMFWMRNILTVLCPFGALTYMNAMIVLKLRKQYQKQQYKKMYAGLFALTMVGAKSPYDDLQAASDMGEKNTDEIQESGAKRSYKDATFTTIGIVNVYIIATVLCGTLRLPVAVICNSLIRQEIRKTVYAFLRLFSNSPKLQKHYSTIRRNRKQRKRRSSSNSSDLKRLSSTINSTKGDGGGRELIVINKDSKILPHPRASDHHRNNSNGGTGVSVDSPPLIATKNGWGQFDKRTNTTNNNNNNAKCSNSHRPQYSIPLNSNDPSMNSPSPSFLQRSQSSSVASTSLKILRNSHSKSKPNKNDISIAHQKQQTTDGQKKISIDSGEEGFDDNEADRERLCLLSGNNRDRQSNDDQMVLKTSCCGRQSPVLHLMSGMANGIGMDNHQTPKCYNTNSVIIKSIVPPNGKCLTTISKHRNNGHIIRSAAVADDDVDRKDHDELWLKNNGNDHRHRHRSDATAGATIPPKNEHIILSNGRVVVNDGHSGPIGVFIEKPMDKEGLLYCKTTVV